MVSKQELQALISHQQEQVIDEINKFAAARQKISERGGAFLQSPLGGLRNQIADKLSQTPCSTMLGTAFLAGGVVGYLGRQRPAHGNGRTRAESIVLGAVEPITAEVIHQVKVLAQQTIKNFFWPPTRPIVTVTPRPPAISESPETASLIQSELRDIY